ncbi:hypothetical protein OAB57_04110 [Bacteriovoracaceae bacterium]|nr:hypothetical protein [Bacteriovoracaceae bacterium]
MTFNVLSHFSKLVFLAFLISGCASYERFRYFTQEFDIPSKVYHFDFTQTWQAVIQVMKKFDLERQNQETGVIKTRWIDNTYEINFSDSFASSDAVKGAKYKLTLNIVKGYRLTREVAKVTIYKRQLVEQDFLQGWKEIPSDNILEEVLLYRIERLLTIEKKLRDIEIKREEEALKNF